MRKKIHPGTVFNRYGAYIILAAAAIIVLTVVFTAGGGKKKIAVLQDCGPYRTDKIVRVNNNLLNAEEPQTKQDFLKGLGGRPCILPSEAMLFPFTRPGYYPFWMKDMKFPIDVVWISASHKVVAVQADEKPPPSPLRKLTNQTPAQFVLELKANRSKELGINIGTTVVF